MEHIHQTQIDFLGHTRAGARLVRINGGDYVVGSASGEGCNCLIDTLRQKMGNCLVSLPAVRAKLQLLFPGGEEKVTDDNFLELGFHWRAVLRLLGEETGQSIDPSRFSIFCLDLDAYQGNGDVVGSGGAILRIARENGNHFVPLLRYHGQ